MEKSCCGEEKSCCGPSNLPSTLPEAHEEIKELRQQLKKMDYRIQVLVRTVDQLNQTQGHQGTFQACPVMKCPAFQNQEKIQACPVLNKCPAFNQCKCGSNCQCSKVSCRCNPCKC